MTTKATLLTVLCLILFTPVVCAQTASRLFADARAAESGGKRDMAFLLYRQIVREYPDSEYVEEAQFFIGKYHYGSRNYFNAERTFRDHLRRFPQSRFSKDIKDYLAKMGLRSLKERADALFEQGRFGPASVLYLQYLEVDPDNADVKARLEKMKKAQEEAHFGFEQLNRERKKLALEKADLNRQIAQLEERRKEVLAMQKEAQELNKVTVAKYEEQLAGVHSQVEGLKKEMADLAEEMKAWRHRAVLAEAARLSQPLPKRFRPVPNEISLPRIMFEGGKIDPSLKEGEVQVSDIIGEGFPAVVVTETRLDTQENVRHVEAVVIADLTSLWPDGTKMKFRVDFVGKEGQAAPDPGFIVRYYDASDMDEIDETTRSYRKRLLFTAEENKVSRYEVSAFLVKTE